MHVSLNCQKRRGEVCIITAEVLLSLTIKAFRFEDNKKVLYTILNPPIPFVLETFDFTCPAVPNPVLIVQKIRLNQF